MLEFDFVKYCIRFSGFLSVTALLTISLPPESTHHHYPTPHACARAVAADVAAMRRLSFWK